MSDQGQVSGKQLFADINTEGAVLTARLVGPNMGQREAPIISSMVQEHIAESTTPLRFIVLDFREIEFISSVGLGVCVEIHNNAKSRKAVVVLYGLRPDAESLFKMTRMDKIFKLADSEKRLVKIIGK